MSRKKDPVRRVFDLYTQLLPGQRDGLKNMISGFDLANNSGYQTSPASARNFRRKPAAQSAVSQPNNQEKPQ